MWGDDATYQRLLGRVPIGRLGEPADFAGAVVFLASRASDWMTGSVMYVDGGYTAG
jgi:NAD(P)-dependent dehydrogenase (short-subunit alcohol dehydrogenase family)